MKDFSVGMGDGRPTDRKRDDIAAHIIAVSSQLFYQKGIRAVGIEEILREAAVAKATLYRHFPSKEALIVAYLNHRSAYALRRLRDSGVDIEDAREQIVAAFTTLDTNLASPDFRGCAFLLAVSEHGETPAVREVAVRHKLAVLEYFVGLVRAAGIASDALAPRLTLIYDGALATAAVRPYAGAGSTALGLVRLLLGEPAGALLQGD